MCRKCSELNIEVQKHNGMRVALNKKVNIYCPECEQSCETLDVGVGDEIFVNHKKVATVDVETHDIKVKE